MDIGTVHQIDIDEQMRLAYLDYAMSVIVARALPDARDGLKPVHRRILYAMYDMGVRSNSTFKKSARIVGEVLGKYHPHGDVAVYDAMARMAQDFSMRYLLIEGQGNFGSIDGDQPAAMRYTEARMHRLAEEMLADIDMNTVDFGDNFDGSLKEPLVLPARLPNLLVNGSSGIAVGMATNIPPHNLNEVAALVDHLIERYSQEDGSLNLEDVTVEELMQHIPGPDFPTGGVIVGSEGIVQAYSTGRGRVVLRGLAHIEEMSGSRNRIVITEIPYQLNKTTLLERIAELVREGRLEDISDLRDESDRRGMSIIIELRRGADPGKVLNKLYKYTPLQSTFGVQMLALVEGEPRMLSLKRALQVYIEHRREVITRRTQFELEKARARAHILDGLLIALANLDEVIRTIRESSDADQAKERLITRFKLSEIQAQAILDMQLRRLAALERQKIEDEMTSIRARIADLEDLLAHPRRVLASIRTDLNEIAAKYGDKRRTHIAGEAIETFREEDLVPDEAILIAVTQKGYIRRMAAKSVRIQGRGGRGVSGIAPKEEDAVLMLMPARTLDTLLFFSDRGKVYSEKAYQIPDSDRAGKGISLANIISIEQGETITAAVPVPSFDEGRSVTMATTQGKVKRMSLSEFSSVRPSGLLAIKLDKGDVLGWVRLTSDKDEIILVTEMGKALRCPVSTVRPMGRAAGGVTGIRMAAGDLVTSMDVVEEAADLILITSGGFGKRTSLNEFPAKGRGTGGVTAADAKSFEKTGKVVSARVAREQDDVTIISTAGTVMRMQVKNIKLMGRATRGLRLIDLSAGTKVSSLARISAEELRQAGSVEAPAGNGTQGNEKQS